MMKVGNSIKGVLKSLKFKLKNTQVRITAMGRETYTSTMIEGESVQHGDRTQKVTNSLRKKVDSGEGRREPGR